MKKIHSGKNGYIALISVIIIGAVTLSMVITSAMIGINQLKNSLLYSDHMKAINIASACAEDALMNIKNNQNYLGDETINLGQGQCQILPIINLEGQSRIIKIVGIVNGATKKIKVEISQIDPTITIESWQEVADF